MMHGRKSSGPRLLGKLWQVNWTLVLLIAILASIGFAMLYSAANGNLSPWASRQMAIFAFGLVVMLGIGLYGHVGQQIASENAVRRAVPDLPIS